MGGKCDRVELRQPKLSFLVPRKRSKVDIASNEDPDRTASNEASSLKVCVCVCVCMFTYHGNGDIDV